MNISVEQVVEMMKHSADSAAAMFYDNYRLGSVGPMNSGASGNCQ
jgi:hypothetical protein